jgi:glycosyltransferase involved in cell wall biosynthesis
VKVAQLNYWDAYGGAARAAYRIHSAVREMDVSSRMLVAKVSSGDWNVLGPEGKVEKLGNLLRYRVGAYAQNLSKSENPIIHSPALMRSCWPTKLNSSDYDLVHFHWIGNGMLSIADVARFTKPIVWTLHDMWAFCGAEHLSDDMRWIDGYYGYNRPKSESGLDINRWTWRRKLKHWKKPMQIVAPSHWLANCAKESVIMRDWPVSVVPNPIDTRQWSPINQSVARQLLSLPADVPLLLFGAQGGTAERHKGYDLLMEAIALLRDHSTAKGLELVIFGEAPPRQIPRIGFPVHYLGYLHDDISLRAMYSAATMLLIPSRKDNLPNTGVEALSCGTPLVAFDVCGLPDLVKHKTNGYLAKAMETQDLADGIIWAISSDVEIRKKARSFAQENFSFEVIAPKYLKIYEQVLD